MAVQDVWESSPAVERLQALVEPVHPDRLGVTMVAVWVSLGTLLLGLPVAFLSLVGAGPHVSERGALVGGAAGPRIMGSCPR